MNILNIILLLLLTVSITPSLSAKTLTPGTTESLCDDQQIIQELYTNPNAITTSQVFSEFLKEDVVNRMAVFNKQIIEDLKDLAFVTNNNPMANDQEKRCQAFAFISRALLVSPASKINFDLANHFSFEKAMTEMAPKGSTPEQVDEFVENLFLTFTEDVSVSSGGRDRLIEARSQANDFFTNAIADGQWRQSFKFAAMTLRPDLRNNDTAGEGRLVYGVDNSFTIILEYKLPVGVAGLSKKSWLKDIRKLGTTKEAASYANVLKAVTAKFWKRNPKYDICPNQNCINQVRTNEIKLDAPWEIREFFLSTQGTLKPRAVTASPDTNDVNDRDEIIEFIEVNKAKILSGKLPLLPKKLWGGSAKVPDGFRWGQSLGLCDNTSSDLCAAANTFSVSTCQGCHGGDTEALPFIHIAPPGTSDNVDGIGDDEIRDDVVLGPRPQQPPEEAVSNPRPEPAKKGPATPRPTN